MEIIVKKYKIFLILFLAVLLFVLKMVIGLFSLFKFGWKIRFFRFDRIWRVELIVVVKLFINIDIKFDLIFG